MDNAFRDQTNNDTAPVCNSEAAIRHFQEGLASGKHWYISLLEAIGLWTDETEEVQGQRYRYLIDGEAFDWLLLAERICDTADGKVPEDEKYDLLFKGKPPLDLTAGEFKQLIGDSKYHQYLNYFYGITVEEALLQAVREELRKERLANIWSHRGDEEEEVFTRIYGSTRSALLKQFRKARKYHQHTTRYLTQWKEFTYWSFKYRVKECEKAKVASDTHKALEWLKKNGFKHQGLKIQ